MTATLNASATATLVPPWNASEEATRRAYRKVKAPFVLTEMNRCREFTALWLWSRRGKSWIIEQELDPSLFAPPTRKDP